MTAADEAGDLCICTARVFRRFGRALLSAANDGAREKGAPLIWSLSNVPLVLMRAWV